MIIDNIFNDISECRYQIEKDFKVNLSNNLNDQIVLMRGENFPHDKTESSMKRFLTSEDGKTMKPFHYVSPFIDFEDIYAEFHSETYGLSEDEGVGFLQHYGFPTDLFDLSPSFETASFFASYGRASDPIGIIGVFDWKELCNYCLITDLTNHPFALSPKKQAAYAARPKHGINDLKDSRCDSLFTSRWYKYYKNARDFSFAEKNESQIYPTESELAHFFGKEFDEFFKNHWAYKEMQLDQRNLVIQKLNDIRNQLK